MCYFFKIKSLAILLATLYLSVQLSDKVPVIKEIKTVNATKLFVSWDPIVTDPQEEDVIGYKIHISNYNRFTKNLYTKEYIVQGKNTKELLITNLPFNATYDFKIQAYYASGDGPFSSIMKYKHGYSTVDDNNKTEHTDNSKTTLTTDVHDFTSVIFSLNPNDNTTTSPGPVDDNEDKLNVEINNNDTSKNISTTTVRILRPVTSVPQILQIATLLPPALLVVWTYLEDISGEDIMTGYKVRCKEAVDSHVKLKLRSDPYFHEYTNFGLDNTMRMFKKLKVDTWYEVKVAAFYTHEGKEQLTDWSRTARVEITSTPYRIDFL